MARPADDFGSDVNRPGDAEALLLSRRRGGCLAVELVFEFLQEAGALKAFLHDFLRSALDSRSRAPAGRKPYFRKRFEGVRPLKHHADARAVLNGVNLGIVDILLLDSDFAPHTSVVWARSSG